MPRLSLYKPEKGADYKFFDRNIWEMFQVGGTDVLVHKFIGSGAPAAGAGTPTQPTYTTTDPTNIQDLLFLENRDRKYDPDVFVMRGIYNIQDIDFNLSQFGLFIQNDTIFITFHINDTVERLGRKLIAGDVIELPHLKDDYALNDLSFALKRFYVIQEVNRASEGFSATWYPHLYRAKCTPIMDSQEFKDILDAIQTDADGNPTTTTLRDIVSTYEKEMQITQAVLEQAELDAPRSGFDTSRFFTVPVDENGNVKLVTADGDTVNASSDYVTNGDGYYIDVNGAVITDTSPENLAIHGVRSPISATTILATPVRDGYQNYHEEAGTPNGAPFTSGITFPPNPVEGQFCLRTDYFPKRLFRYSGKRWVKYEDNVRMTLSNNGTDSTEPRLNQRGTFINNNKINNIDGKQVPEKQSLSKALRPKADE